jgi:hypothetical protein
MRPEEVPDGLAHVAERRKVFAFDDDNVRAYLFGVRYQHELLDATSSGDVVACCQDAFLLHTQRQRLQSWVAVLQDRGVEAVVILDTLLAGMLIVNAMFEGAHKVQDDPVVLSSRRAFLKVLHCEEGPPRSMQQSTS